MTFLSILLDVMIIEKRNIISLNTDKSIWDHFYTVAPLVVIGTKEGDGFDLAPKHMATLKKRHTDSLKGTTEKVSFARTQVMCCTCGFHRTIVAFSKLSDSS